MLTRHTNCKAKSPKSDLILLAGKMGSATQVWRQEFISRQGGCGGDVLSRINLAKVGEMNTVTNLDFVWNYKYSLGVKTN